MINWRKLTKKQFDELFSSRCKHGHLYAAHQNCWREEKRHPEKLGFIDLEFFGLSANWGIILCWVIADSKGKMAFDVIKKIDLEKYLDKRLVRSCIKEMEKYDVLIGHYSSKCLTAGHRVLTADWQWKPVEQVKEGERIIGFSEVNKETHRRYFEETKVLRNVPEQAEVFDLHLSDGSKLTATSEHRFLLRGRAKCYRWASVNSLYSTFNSKKYLGGIQFNRMLPVWEYKDSYMAGYLAGIKLIEIKKAGIQQVWRLSTSSHTYLAEGFGCHNCDLPYVLTRALYHHLNYPHYNTIKQADVWIMSRSKLRLNSNRQRTISSLLRHKSGKTEVKPESWLAALRGDKKALDYILAHCKIDVKELRLNYLALEPYCPKSRRSL